MQKNSSKNRNFQPVNQMIIKKMILFDKKFAKHLVDYKKSSTFASQLRGILTD